MRFYKKYIAYDSESGAKYKEKYIKDSLEKGLLYKFVSFTGEVALDEAKFKCLENETIWMSYYKYFDDPSELKIILDKREVSERTKTPIERIEAIADIYREIYDICCFTNRIDDYMWDNYANDSKGICLCFEIKDYDKYFPVEYIDKGSLNLTESVIKSIEDERVGRGFDSIGTKEAAILPLVLKDIKDKEESEIRIMISPFDDENGIFKGRVKPDIKEKFGYRGIARSYSDIGLELAEVIIGKNCSHVHQTRVHEIIRRKSIVLQSC